MFRRRRRERDDEVEAVDVDEPVEVDEEPAADDEVTEEPAAAEPTRPSGPWDAEDAPDDVERFDLGALRLVVPEGAQVQLEVTPDGTVLPTLFLGDGALQLSAFAAPRREGIWAEVREEIVGALRADGGSAEEADGPFGPELRAVVPVQAPDGALVGQPARFVGVDGPRWFLRGLFSGAAAVDAGAAAPLEAVFRDTVVVRGADAMAPRDPLPIAVPRDVLDAAGVPPEAAAQLNPFARGPEITEVR